MMESRSGPWVRCAVAALTVAGFCASAQAWEVVNSGLPSFAVAAPLGPSSGVPALDPVAGLRFEKVAGVNPGYDYRIGGKYLFGFEQQAGLAAGGSLLGLANGFDYSRSTMKFGYDLGAFKPFVSASFAQTTAPAFGANLFAGPPGAANPFAPAATATTVGAGFDYAITDKLSLGVSVSATQTSGWPR